MADGPGLWINIGADLGDAVRDFKQLSAAVTDTSKAMSQLNPTATQAAGGLDRVRANAGQAATAFRTLNAAEGQTTPLLNQTGNAAAKAGESLKKVVPGANQAGAALINVGRVAQDLPFGFVGIQNNLNPLLESFQRLKAETGSGSAALKALGQSLLGPAGIGIALSVVSAAILIFQNGIAGFNKKSKEAKDSADELAKAIRSIASIEGEATASVQGQIAQVNSLARAVSDTTLTYDERKRALQELREVNKNYFGDLKLEDAATSKLTDTIKEYNKALINSAIQKQFIDEIAKVAKAISDSDQEVEKSISVRKRASAELDKATAAAQNSNQVNARTGELTNAANAASERRREAASKEKDAIKAVSIAQETNLTLKNQAVILENRLNAATIEGFKFKDLQSSSEKKATDLLKQRIDALKELRDATGLDLGQREEFVRLQIELARRDGIKLGFKASEIEEQVQAIIDKEFQGQEKSVKVQLPLKVEPTSTIDVAGAVIPDGIIPPTAFDGVINQIRAASGIALQKINENLAEGIRGSILNGVVDGLVGIGDALGGALAGIFNGNVGAGLAKAGQALLGIIGGVLQDIGKQIIVASTLVQALKKALSSLFANPAAGVAVGIALVALGGLLKNIKFNTTPGFADGVTGFTGGLALVGERGPELVRLPAGSDVIPNNRIGDVSAIAGFIASTELRGRDIFISYNRTRQTNRRI